jgi:ribA/ribD-fused uncharacterized protein
MSEIGFYETQGPHGYLSNFAAYPIRLRGKVWPTSEHYFQAQKFAGTEHEEAVRATASAMIAARMGRSRARPLRADWEAVKDAIMLEALRAKFSQHSDLRAQLLATGDARIVEHTKNDAYWADGGDGGGKNRLGELLEQVRDELRDAVDHARAWQRVMKPGRGWVSFLFGTCVVLPSAEGDLADQACAILAEHGPVQVGTDRGDFGVHGMPDDFGWLVSGAHPDVLVRVAPATAEGSSELVIGLVGRQNRDRDAESLVVVHVQDAVRE